MGEVKELALSVVVMIILSAMAIVVMHLSDIFPSGYDIVDYHATLKKNGILYENYTYVIYSPYKYHMLYRNWNSPLLYGKIDKEGIYLLNISVSGKYIQYIPYVKTYLNGVYIVGNVSYTNDDLSYIAQKSETNEAGIYVPYGIPSGKYVVSYVFLLYPTLEYGGGLYHLSISLANKHHIYKNVVIDIPKDFKVFSSPYLEKREYETKTELRGYVDGDFPIKLDLFFNKINNFSYASVKNVSGDTYSKVKEKYFFESLNYNVAKYLAYFLFYLIIAFPIIYVIAYILFGRDKAGEVEEEVISPPKRRKPWIVNLVFRNEGEGIDYSSATIATILDLHRRGFIEISPDGKKIKIIQRNFYGKVDIFEKEVMMYIRDRAYGDVFDLEKFKKEFMEASNRLNYSKLRSMSFEPKDPKFSKEIDKVIDSFIHIPTKKFVMLFVFIISYISVLFFYYLFFASTYVIYYLYIIFLALIYVFDVIAMWWHPEVVGRWKDDYYTEKLRWDKFMEFLKNEKKVKEYYTMYSSYVEDWLIYGYALGVGYKVSKTLSIPEISFPMAQMAKNVSSYFVYTLSYSSVGGGAGVAGGGGVGGAGAR